MDRKKYIGDTSALYQRLKQKGLSNAEIETQLEKAFGNSWFDNGEELVLSDEEKEDFFDEMRAQGWGLLIDNKTK